MINQLFAFTLNTKKGSLNINNCIFSADGEVIGRILYKSKPSEITNFTYHIESSKEVYEKIKNGDTKIYGIEEYSVSDYYIAYIKK